MEKPGRPLVFLTAWFPNYVFYANYVLEQASVRIMFVYNGVLHKSYSISRSIPLIYQVKAIPMRF